MGDVRVVVKVRGVEVYRDVVEIFPMFLGSAPTYVLILVSAFEDGVGNFGRGDFYEVWILCVPMFVCDWGVAWFVKVEWSV